MPFVGPRPAARLGDRITYPCPCCGVAYETLVVGHNDFSHPVNIRASLEEIPYVVDEATTTDGSPLAICGRCHQPCCPRCERGGSEGIVCTRCAAYPTCTHLAAAAALVPT